MSTDRPPVLEVRGVHRFFFVGNDTEVSALLNVSFSVAAGEFVAVVGRSGSGKTTLMNLLCGIDEPSGGSVWVDGERLSHRSRTEQTRRRGSSVGIMTQASGLIEHLTVEENVSLAAVIRRRAQSHSGTDGDAREPQTEAQRQSIDPAELLEEVGLGHRRSARPSVLSGGETARANLAVALAGGPRVLIADEPTAEISRTEEQAILALLSAMRPADGVTVVVTHSDVVAGAADRVLVLDKGVLSEREA